MGRGTRPAVAATVAVLAVAGCTTAPGRLLDSAPPPVTVAGGGSEIALEPWTYCWRNGCADGVPPQDPPDLGSPARVTVSFPRPGWSLRADLQPAGEPCGRVQTVALAPGEDGGSSLAPAGPAGVYDVVLMGSGPGGDVATSFRWTTPVDGPMPVPSARLAVLADHDGRVDSYGVELALDGLAATPREASATVTVTPAEGDPVTFEATPGTATCLPEGSLRFDGPDAQGLEAAASGPPPFDYEVQLVLDGVEHRATATWPPDEVPDGGPSVELDVAPPLPRLAR